MLVDLIQSIEALIKQRLTFPEQEEILPDYSLGLNCNPAIFGLTKLHKHMSQFLKINIFICVWKCAHTHPVGYVALENPILIH